MLQDFSIFVTIYNMGISHMFIKKKIIASNKYRINLNMRFFEAQLGPYTEN